MFDFLICKSDKPSFFTDKNKPFFVYDENDQKFRGETFFDMKQGKNVVEGNSKFLEQIIR